MVASNQFSLVQTSTVQCDTNASGGNATTASSRWALMGWPYGWTILWAMDGSSSFSGYAYVQLRVVWTLPCASAVLNKREEG